MFNNSTFVLPERDYFNRNKHKLQRVNSFRDNNTRYFSLI